MTAKAPEGEKLVASNRKAFFNYEILEKAEAGIVLRGTEVKSIREGGLNFRDSFVEYREGELWLVGCRIGPYSHGNLQNHTEGRDRKLLLHRREIDRLWGLTRQQGYTLIPLRLYFTRGKAKVALGVCRGKKAHDKRHAIAERDAKREAQRAMKGIRD